MSSVHSCKTYIEMWLCSQGHISDPMRDSLFQIITFVGLTVSHEEKAELSQWERHSPLSCRPASSCFNRTHWVCIPNGNSELLCAAVCKSPDHAWNVADIIQLITFRHKKLLSGDLNAKHPFWNGIVSNPSGTKLLNILHINEFAISAPQCPTHYCPAGNVLNIVVSRNVRISEVIVSDILGSDHLLVVFHLNSQIGSGFKARSLN
jgi:hypothetical protein